MTRTGKVGWCLLTVLVAAMLGGATTEEQQALAVLRDKGLEMDGALAVLRKEREVMKGVVALRRAKAALGRAEAAMATFEREEAQAEQVMANMKARLRYLARQTARVQTVQQYNATIDQMNQIQTNLETLIKQKEQREKEVEHELGTASAHYVAEIGQLTQLNEDVAAQYKKAAGDAAVQQALTQLSKGRPHPVTLGPSRNFVVLRAMEKRYAAELYARDIALHAEGNVMTVDVVLNGKEAHQMVLDTGASLVTLPFDLAADVGIKPSAADPTIHLRIADGSIVSGKLMKLDSVQVGPFVVKNVPCVVLPAQLTTAPPLLGNSFLKNFVFHLDQDKHTLRLTRVGTSKNVSIKTKTDKDEKGRSSAASDSHGGGANGGGEGR